MGHTPISEAMSTCLPGAVPAGSSLVELFIDCASPPGARQRNRRGRVSAEARQHRPRRSYQNPRFLQKPGEVGTGGQIWSPHARSLNPQHIVLFRESAQEMMFRRRVSIPVVGKAEDVGVCQHDLIKAEDTRRRASVASAARCGNVSRRQTCKARMRHSGPVRLRPAMWA